MRGGGGTCNRWPERPDQSPNRSHRLRSDQSSPRSTPKPDATARVLRFSWNSRWNDCWTTRYQSETGSTRPNFLATNSHSNNSGWENCGTSIHSGRISSGNPVRKSTIQCFRPVNLCSGNITSWYRRTPSRRYVLPCLEVIQIGSN